MIDWNDITPTSACILRWRMIYLVRGSLAGLIQSSELGCVGVLTLLSINEAINHTPRQQDGGIRLILMMKIKPPLKCWVIHCLSLTYKKKERFIRMKSRRSTHILQCNLDKACTVHLQIDTGTFKTMFLYIFIALGRKFPASTICQPFNIWDSFSSSELQNPPPPQKKIFHYFMQRE